MAVTVSEWVQFVVSLNRTPDLAYFNVLSGIGWSLIGSNGTAGSWERYALYYILFVHMQIRNLIRYKIICIHFQSRKLNHNKNLPVFCEIFFPPVWKRTRTWRQNCPESQKVDLELKKTHSMSISCCNFPLRPHFKENILQSQRSNLCFLPAWASLSQHPRGRTFIRHDLRGLEPLWLTSPRCTVNYTWRGCLSRRADGSAGLFGSEVNESNLLTTVTGG